jgi:hypothetical protein
VPLDQQGLTTAFLRLFKGYLKQLEDRFSLE